MAEAQRWEYYTLQIHMAAKRGPEEADAHLQALGQQGWEAVLLLNSHSLLMKRAIGD